MSESIEKIYEIFLKHPVVCTDTRKLIPGSIFFSLKGGSFNGNKFAAMAIEEGCAYSVIDEKEYAGGDKYILVDDVLTTLQQLAAHHRRQLNIPIIAVTGSNGKTTTKELIHAVLQKKFAVYATEGNLNNHIGVPLSLLKINGNHQMGVIEMGANHQGEIAFLCELAHPDFGLITNIGKAHLEGFGGPEGVIKGKTEMYNYVRAHSGILFVNADNVLLEKLAGATNKYTYGTGSNCDVTGKLYRENPSVDFTFHSLKNDDESGHIVALLMGKYNFENILGAVAIGEYFGVERNKIKQAIEEYSPDNSRSQIIKKGNNTILLDAYNANPTSMEAAIRNFSAGKPNHPLLILGDMFELGDDSLSEHKKLIGLLTELQFMDVILVGKVFNSLAPVGGFKSFETTGEAMSYLLEQKPSNKNILIKGSRGMKLEQILDAIR
jgi:UDP-N-acetylmuramoyl-tripeptide--D-alanyl-D-alanine ligase